MKSNISASRFKNKLLKNPYENPSLIKLVDDFFISHRGYTSKPLGTQDHVILLYSGGVDSTVAWAYLLANTQVNVYPLILNRGTNRKKKELNSSYYFHQYFTQKYPTKNVLKPFNLSTELIPKEVERLFAKDKIHPQAMLKYTDGQTGIFDYAHATGITPFIMYLYPALYASILEYKYGIHVNSIVSAINASDGSPVSSQTYTSLKIANLSLVTATNKKSWNLKSLFIDFEDLVWYEKIDVMKLGYSLNLPLHKTWSCYYSNRRQCGQCATCKNRQHAYKTLGIKDNTNYIKSIH